MTIKKLIAGAAGAGLVLTMTGAVLANDAEVEVKNTDTYVTNHVTTQALTGDIEVHGKYVGKYGKGPRITTGRAEASTQVMNDVNSTVMMNPNLDDVEEVEVENDDTYLNNHVYTKAHTGNVNVHGYKVGKVKVTTGSAEAMAVLTNSVNYTLLGETL
jgi:uncharacterized protein (AIM24 family)